MIVERNVIYGRAGDIDLIMHICSPDGHDKLRPAMLIVHGGGWAAGEAEGAMFMCEEMCDMGFRCFNIEYRLTGTELFPAQIEDCKTAVRHIRANAEKYNIDPDRIGAYGHSAGGHLVSLLATAPKGIFEPEDCPVSSEVTAVINYSGPCNMNFFYIGGGEGLRNIFRDDETGIDEWVKKASPVELVTKASAPQLLIMGDADDIISWAIGEEMYRKALQVGAPVEYHLYKGGWHIMDKGLYYEDMKAFCTRYFGL